MNPRHPAARCMEDRLERVRERQVGAQAAVKTGGTREGAGVLELELTGDGLGVQSGRKNQV